MSILFKMIAANARLAGWESFDVNTRSAWSSKQPEKLAAIIFAQLSHPKVVDLVVIEYDNMPPQVKLELRQLCNSGNATGNVRKNLQILNKRLNGQLLSEEKHERTVNVRKERQTGVVYEKKVVNEAVAAAQRKYQKG